MSRFKGVSLMTMYLYSGFPGTGKSLHAVGEIVFQMGTRKKPVIANMPLTFEKYNEKRGLHSELSSDLFTYLPNKDFNVGFLLNFAAEYFKDKDLKEHSILLVIDEAQLLFNSRTYQEADRKLWLEFFSQHRHLGYEVILVAQNFKMVDRQIRFLCEYEVRHRKLSSFGVLGWLLAHICGGQVFACNHYYMDDPNHAIQRQFFTKRKHLFSLYDTFNVLHVNPSENGLNKAILSEDDLEEIAEDMEGDCTA